MRTGELGVKRLLSACRSPVSPNSPNSPVSPLRVGEIGELEDASDYPRISTPICLNILLTVV